jgi:ribosomal protein S18 acetylase RimI-like enzyme
VSSDSKTRPSELKPVVLRDRFTIPASSYNYNQLASIYNQARVDYIVPMPMNGHRMAEYCRFYDVDLDSSFVSLNADKLESGIAMLGVRGDRSWITRLGVIPERRGRKIGQFLAEALIEESRRRQMSRVQLEVIVGNEPAHQLFLKLGFEPVRELLVIRRPPSLLKDIETESVAQVTNIEESQFKDILEQRTDLTNWLDENASLLNAGDLRGFQIELRDGQRGWIVFQRTPFQLTRFVTGPISSPEVMRALLVQVHKEYPTQDTKIENLPADSPVWPVYQSVGYIEVFRRTEMYLTL